MFWSIWSTQQDDAQSSKFSLIPRQTQVVTIFSSPLYDSYFHNALIKSINSTRRCVERKFIQIHWVKPRLWPFLWGFCPYFCVSSTNIIKWSNFKMFCQYGSTQQDDVFILIVTECKHFTAKMVEMWFKNWIVRFFLIHGTTPGVWLRGRRTFIAYKEFRKCFLKSWSELVKMVLGNPR